MRDEPATPEDLEDKDLNPHGIQVGDVVELIPPEDWDEGPSYNDDMYIEGSREVDEIYRGDHYGYAYCRFSSDEDVENDEDHTYLYDLRWLNKLKVSPPPEYSGKLKIGMTVRSVQPNEGWGPSRRVQTFVIKDITYKHGYGYTCDCEGLFYKVKWLVPVEA
jgi:hypothetical protein